MILKSKKRRQVGRLGGRGSEIKVGNLKYALQSLL